MTEIDSAFNDYFVENKLYKVEAFNNLPFFIKLLESLIEIISDELNDKIFNNLELHSCDLFTIFELVQNFYNDYNVNIDIEELIRNGTIDVKFKKKINLNACNGYKGKKRFKFVKFNYSDHLIDATSLVHELSHFRNQPDKYRSVSNDFMTEALSFYDEILFAKYLMTHNAIDDGKYLLHSYLDICLNNAEYNLCFTKIFNVFTTFGMINKENYNLLYNDDNYDEIMKFVEEEIEDYDYYEGLYYTFGHYINFKLLNKYLDKDYEPVNKLNDLIQDMDYMNYFENIEEFDQNRFETESKKLIKTLKRGL